jgi:hypothetical protein
MKKKDPASAHEAFGVKKKEWVALVKRFKKERDATEDAVVLAQKMKLKGKVAALGYLFGRTIEANATKMKISKAVEKTLESLHADYEGDESEGPGLPKATERPSYFG